MTHPVTHPAPTQAQPAPSRAWYLVAALILVAGWAAMATFLLARLGGISEHMMRVVVPGDAELRLSEPGTYTIFHEYRSSLDGRVYDVPTLSGLEIAVRALPGRENVSLTQAMSSSYKLNAVAGRSLFNFEVQQPGAYQISAAYSDGRREPQTVLAVDRGFVGGLLLTILGSLALALAGSGIAAAIIVVVAIKRYRARRSPAPA